VKKIHSLIQKAFKLCWVIMDEMVAFWQKEVHNWYLRITYSSIKRVLSIFFGLPFQIMFAPGWRNSLSIFFPLISLKYGFDVVEKSALPS
jgi:hypothetical protein